MNGGEGGRERERERAQDGPETGPFTERVLQHYICSAVFRYVTTVAWLIVTDGRVKTISALKMTVVHSSKTLVNINQTGRRRHTLQDTGTGALVRNLSHR